MDKTLITIKNLTRTWFEKINLGKKYNTPISIGFSDDEFELLTCIEHNIKGTGSISHGYDHDNKDETKGTSLVQPKKCTNCGGKLHFFAEKCSCNSTDFEYISDSRWSIDSKAHFEYGIPLYHLWVLYPEKNSYDCNKFYLKQYVIDANNEHFIEILKTQNELGKSKNKNFLPFSADFYASNPIEITSIIINFDQDFGIVVERNKTKTIEYDEKILKKMSKTLNKNFKIIKYIYQYNEIFEFIDIKNKKTTHGKERGKTIRRTK
jgi:hypothetical protein